MGNKAINIEKLQAESRKRWEVEVRRGYDRKQYENRKYNKAIVAKRPLTYDPMKMMEFIKTKMAS